MKDMRMLREASHSQNHHEIGSFLIICAQSQAADIGVKSRLS
jgi:hypothetical protein